jgi:serine/threonine protein kinase
LTPQFENDVERINRFKKEARAVSALNHPNIITIYAIEETETGNFIATEFIDGQTLRERIAERPMSWQEAVKIAIQITGALKPRTRSHHSPRHQAREHHDSSGWDR